jgi:hypothetical protein
VWTSAKLLVKGVFSHWIQSLGGALMALIGLVAAIQNWTVPPRVWLALSAAVFLWAIVQVFHEVRVMRDQAVGALSKKRIFQRIADTLTTEYAFAVHELAGKSPRYDAERDEAFLGEFKVWFDGIKAWNEKVKVMLAELGCTPQEQARFWTIDELKPGMMIRGDSWEVAMRMHDTRVGRLWEIIEAGWRRTGPTPG